MPFDLAAIVSNPFWFTAAVGGFATRFLADYLRLRLHIKGMHIHHFLLGIILFVPTCAAFYYDQPTAGFLLGGLVTALILSEAKELVIQQWGE